MLKLMYGQRIHELPQECQAGKFNEQCFWEEHFRIVYSLLQRWEFFSISER
jgi:hypothetical protein